MKLATLQKAQMLVSLIPTCFRFETYLPLLNFAISHVRKDLTMPTGGNRSIFIAKNKYSEIIGCCEVIEEKIDLSYSDSNTTNKKTVPKKIARLRRPIIENLSVRPEYRRKGIGQDLVHACENAVQLWIPKHYEIYAQVEETNTSAFNLFGHRGYTSLFVDPNATKTSLDGTLFVKSTTVPKVMFRKFLSSDSETQLF